MRLLLGEARMWAKAKNIRQPPVIYFVGNTVNTSYDKTASGLVDAFSSTKSLHSCHISWGSKTEPNPDLDITQFSILLYTDALTILYIRVRASYCICFFHPSFCWWQNLVQ